MSLKTSGLLNEDLLKKQILATKGRRSMSRVRTPHQLHPLAFSDLLMTFSFEFRSLTDFCGFACSIIRRVQEQIDCSYPYDYITIDQFTISPDDRILIDDPHDFFKASTHLQAPEVYSARELDYDCKIAHNKLLSFQVGILFLEILSQRPLSRIPEGMTAPQYCKYIFRKNRLSNLIKIVVNCCFNNDENFTLQKKAKRCGEVAEFEHVSQILQRMLEEKPTSRLTLDEAYQFFKLYADGFSFTRIRQANANTEAVIQQQIQDDPQQTVQIIRELINSIQNGPRISGLSLEELADIKRQLYTSTQIAQGIKDMQDLLVHAYLQDKDFRCFAYLQQFFLRFYQSTDRVFIADQIGGLVEADYVDSDEYFGTANVFLYFAKTGLFQKFEEAV